MRISFGVCVHSRVTAACLVFLLHTSPARAAGFSVNGIVTDEKGTPIADANVNGMQGTTPLLGASDKTDGEGKFEIVTGSFDGKQIIIAIEAATYDPFRRTIQLNDDEIDYRRADAGTLKLKKASTVEFGAVVVSAAQGLQYLEFDLSYGGTGGVDVVGMSVLGDAGPREGTCFDGGMTNVVLALQSTLQAQSKGAEEYALEGTVTVTVLNAGNQDAVTKDSRGSLSYKKCGTSPVELRFPLLFSFKSKQKERFRIALPKSLHISFNTTPPRELDLSWTPAQLIAHVKDRAPAIHQVSASP